MQSLRAGAGIAPFRVPGWEHSADGTPLAARCLILDDGETRFALVSSTHIGMWQPEATIVRQAVSGATGLPLERILLAATHIHSGLPVLSPDREERLRYARHISAAAAEAAGRACALQPARLGWAADHLPGISRVRRILRRDGSVITLRRACPETWGWATDPETVGPEEPNDDLLTVIRIETPEGQPVAAVMHFACHPLPDFLGYAARLVEQQTPGAVCLILNGCQGTVDTPFEVPMRGRTQAEQLPILGSILGYRTLELLARAETTDQVPLGMAGRPLFLPANPGFLGSPAARSSLWSGVAERGGFDVEVHCLRMGDLAFAGVPGEPQVGFGREVQALSPFALTRVIGITNHTCAYLLSEESRARGGYEANPAYWGVTTGEALPLVREAIRTCLEELA